MHPRVKVVTKYDNEGTRPTHVRLKKMSFCLKKSELKFAFNKM